MIKSCPTELYDEGQDPLAFINTYLRVNRPPFEPPKQVAMEAEQVPVDRWKDLLSTVRNYKELVNQLLLCDSSEFEIKVADHFRAQVCFLRKTDPITGQVFIPALYVTSNHPHWFDANLMLDTKGEVTASYSKEGFTPKLLQEVTNALLEAHKARYEFLCAQLPR